MFRINFPVIRENVQVSYRTLRNEILGLEEGRRTGFVALTVARSRFYLFLDSGHPVGGGVEGETGKRLEAPSVLLDEVEKVLRMERGKADIYEAPSEILHLLVGYFASRTISDDLPGELLDLSGLIAKLRKASFTGFLWGQGVHEVVVFLSFGDVAGVYVAGRRSDISSAVEAVKECKVSIHNTERALEVESAIFSREHKAKLMEDAYVSTYQMVKSRHNGAEGFELLVRESMMVQSEQCPFLNPFLGLLEIRGGRLRVDPAVDPDDLIGGFFRALYAGAKAYLSDDIRVMNEVLALVDDKAREAGIALGS